MAKCDSVIIEHENGSPHAWKLLLDEEEQTIERFAALDIRLRPRTGDL